MDSIWIPQPNNKKSHKNLKKHKPKDHLSRK
jgi:hypothetical protein